MNARHVRAGLGAAALAAVLGCAGPSTGVRLSAESEYMCRHCNCLMPAGIDPEARCPVCDCQMKARECRRDW
jgi:hypothetical protein